MGTRRITLADAVNVTGLTRHQLRNLLNELPEFRARRTSPRVAHTYSKQDLVVISVCAHLEVALGLRREVIGALSSNLRDVISRPRSIERRAYLLIIPIAGGHCLTQSEHPSADEGTVVNLAYLLCQVDAYLLDEQRPLAFSPLALQQASSAQSFGTRARVRR